MELLREHAAWIGLGLLCGLIVGLGLRLARRPHHVARPHSDADLQRELSHLKGQLQQLEHRYHAQLDFFVNFPEVVKSLTAALTQEQVTSACSRAVSALLHTRELALLLCDKPGELCVVDGAGFPGALRGQRFGVAEVGLLGALETRGVTSLRDDPGVGRLVSERQLPGDLAASMWYGDNCLGLILVASTEGELQAVRRILAMLADLSGVALHAAQQVSQIRDKAETDALTHLPNRRTLTTRIQRELQRSRAYQSVTSLVMIDVDHFKHYNDLNGHAAGDQVLRQLAQLALAATRRTDLVARYGGEEFTVVLAGADRDQAFQHAERIRRTIAEHRFPQGESQPLGCVSISLGVASFPTDADTVETLFEAADRALYRAKKNGRNRVVLYDADVDEIDIEVAEHAPLSGDASAPVDPSRPSQP